MHLLSAKTALAFILVVVLSSCAQRLDGNPSSEPRSSTSVSQAVKLAASDFSSIKSFDIFVEGDQNLHLLVSGKISGAKNPLVKYFRSLDGGKTWAKPVSVNAAEVPPTVSRRGSDIQIAARGNNVVAAWQVMGEFPGMGPITLAYSADGGKSWNRGKSIRNQPTLLDQGYMDLAVDTEGTFHLTWLDDREERGDSQALRYSQSLDGGRTWVGEATLVEKVCTCCWTAMATSGKEQVDVLYRAIEPRDMVMVQSPDGGILWEQVSVVGQFGWQFVGCPHAGGAVQTVENNGAIVFHSLVWTGSQSHKGLYYLQSVDKGRSWTKPRKMDDSHAKLGDIAAKDASHVAVVWDSASEKGIDVFFSSSVDGGRFWKKPRRLTKKETVAKYPRIAATSRGYQVFWTEKAESGQSIITTTLIVD